jgi:hypothetical protein
VTEKDTLIKNLREANQRMGVELKDKNSMISRINSPQMTPHNMRSPNQSFVGDYFRHDEEVRMMTEQLERRNEENGKLKKEREVRSKQFKDL